MGKFQNKNCNQQKQQEELISHDKAGVRGFLNEKDFEKVAAIEERLKERKGLIQQALQDQKARQDQKQWTAKKVQDNINDSHNEFKKALKRT